MRGDNQELSEEALVRQEATIKTRYDTARKRIMREKHQSVFKNIEQEEQMVLSDTGILSGPTWAILEETAT